MSLRMLQTEPWRYFSIERSVAEMVGVMLVEDHSLFRQALAVMLDGEPDLRVVAQAGSLAEARERAAALKDLIRIAIVDLALPDGDATGLMTELRRYSPGVKVMIFTASIDPGTEARIREAGASATLHKTASNAEILVAVRRLIGDA